MNKMLTVSVIVPIYNASPYIEKCADSLMAQTYSDIQFVFVDDCSTDDSIEKLQRVIDAHTERDCLIVRLKQNGGSANARLVGLKNASGRYVVMVDSDDYVSDVFIEKLVQSALASDADIVMCDFNYVNQNGAKIAHQSDFNSNEDCMAKVITGEIHSSLCNKLIRKSLYDSHGVYPTPGLNFYDDKSVMYRLVFFANKIKYVKDALYFYNVSNIQSQTHGNYSMKIDSAFRLIAQMDDFFQEHEICSDLLIGALCRFKALVYGTVLLYANDKELVHYKQSFLRFSNKQIWGFVLPFHFKVALLLQDSLLLLSLYRWFYRILHKAFGRLKS